MSKVVFWSPLHGQGQTSNLHIISLVMSLIYKKRVLMMQTHMSLNNLEAPLVGKSMGLLSNEDSSIFQDIGIDAAVMYSRMNMLMADMLESCCLTFPNTSLLLLPATEIRNRETFERDIRSGIWRMISEAEKSVDLVMIDTSCGNDEMSLKLITSADLIVVNLTQRNYMINQFFIEYGEIFKNNKNVFYLFGNYDRYSGYNIYNLLRRYKDYLNKNNSGIIPYCTKYMDAQNDCDILGMVREGLHSRKQLDTRLYKTQEKGMYRQEENIINETDYFFSQVGYSAAKIINMINESGKKTLIARGEL